VQDSFTAVDGAGSPFVCVSYPDVLVARPRMPKTPGELPLVILLPDTDIRMAWLGNYPSMVARRRPVHPNWIGTDAFATFVPAIAPISWMPTLLGFLAAPRLHRVFYGYKADPLSGAMMAVAQQMAWDPYPKTPLFLRPRLLAGQSVLVVPTSVIAAGELCVEFLDVDFTTPTLTGQLLTGPTLLDEAVTIPDLLTEDLC